jgi:hypothetical protein
MDEDSIRRLEIMDAALAPTDARYAEALRILAAVAPECRHVVVRAAPDADGEWAWLDKLHHDLEGALRGVRYLAQKASAAYAEDDARGAKARASIAKHIQTIEQLKRELVDRVLPLAPHGV